MASTKFPSIYDRLDNETVALLQEMRVDDEPGAAIYNGCYPTVTKSDHFEMICSLGKKEKFEDLSLIESNKYTRALWEFIKIAYEYEPGICNCGHLIDLIFDEREGWPESLIDDLADSVTKEVERRKRAREKEAKKKK